MKILNKTTLTKVGEAQVGEPAQVGDGGRGVGDRVKVGSGQDVKGLCAADIEVAQVRKVVAWGLACSAER